MPQLQIDGVNIAELSASEAKTLKRQVDRASKTWLKRFTVEERDPISDPRSSETSWESGTITIVVHYEAQLGSG